LGGILLAAIFGAALAGAALFGVMKYAPEQLNLLQAASGLAGGEAMADLARRIEDLRGQISDLRGRLDSLPQNRPDLGDLPQRLAALEQKVAALPATGAAPSPALPAQITDLPGRVAVLESKLEQAGPAALSTELSALPPEIAVLQQRVAVLEKRAPAQGAGSTADVAALKSDLAAVKDSLAALDGRLKAMAARTGAALALGDLRRTVETGRPYSGPLDALKNMADSDQQLGQALDPSIAALTPMAAAGAPTLADLQAGLSDASTTILAAGGAPEPAASGSFTDRVLAKLQSLVSIQPIAAPEGGNTTGGEATGDTPAAHVARAEAKLTAGDLDAAVAELSALAGKPADAAAPWLAQARTQLTAMKALADLGSAVLAALADAGSGQ